MQPNGIGMAVNGQSLRYTAQIKQKVTGYIAMAALLAADYGALIAALLSAVFCRGLLAPKLFIGISPLVLPHNYIYFLIPLVYIGLISYEGLYTKRLPFWQAAEKMFKVSVFALLITSGLLYFSGEAKDTSRLFVVFSGMFAFLYLTTARYITKRFLSAAGLWQKPVIIVGAGKTAELLAQAFESEPNFGYKIAGLVEDNFAERPLTKRYPYFGTFADAEKAVLLSGVKDVVIAAPGLERQELLGLAYRIQPLVRNLTVVPDLFGMPLSNIEVDTLFNEKTVLLRIRNNMAIMRNRILKRAFDLFGSICGGIIIFPVLLVIAIVIYISDPGPIFFAHQRIGLNGKKFPCYKFRSMVVNAQGVLDEYLAENPAAREEWERDFKLKDDPRITKIGHFLRRTSLDELPQLFNVLKGEMSLVGPRPIVDKEIAKYGEYISDYYLVRPGMTGFWQVSGRNDVDYDKRVQMDSWYVRNWSFWQDMVLLLKTIGVVLGRKGAY